MVRKTVGVVAIILTAAIASSGCTSTPTPVASAAAPGPPAKDLSDIDRYHDADPYKTGAIQDWIAAKVNDACAGTGPSSASLRSDVQARAHQVAGLLTIPSLRTDGMARYVGIVRSTPYPAMTDTEPWCEYQHRLRNWT